MDGKVILKLTGVTRDFEDGEGNPIRVLRGIDLEVNGGGRLAIVGPSGCGKSTLLNIMGALDKPTSGTVELDRLDMSAMGESELASVRNRRIGFVFQFHHLLPQCSALENVLVPTLVGRHGRGSDMADRARRLLDRVGLSHRLSHRPGRLSGGERQRVAVVRALINSPALLLADEPTGSLDRSGSDSLIRLLLDLNAEEGTALVVVTHSTSLAEAMGVSMELVDGRFR